MGDKKQKYEVHTTSNYNTVFLAEKKTEERFEAKAIANLAGLLINENRDIRINALKELRKPFGKELLLQTISENKHNPKLRQIVAACWESGIDFRNDIPFFVQLAVEGEYNICLEVLTILEETENISKEQIADAVKKFEEESGKGANEKGKLYAEIINSLKERLHA